MRSPLAPTFLPSATLRTGCTGTAPSRLGRDVAIEVLPASVTTDTERLARSSREAQVLASLNHPNIAAIYHVEEADGAPAIVMELVEGETLADRITRGPIPIEEALPIAKQIAEALEAAHGQCARHPPSLASNDLDHCFQF
jgi:serine/threonine protein kinase